MLQKFSCADDGVAFACWHEPIGRHGVRELVHAAVLAASAHNSQPWRFKILDGAIEMRADLDRHLGSFDPFRREMHQSLGCALENLVQAARAQGFEADVDTIPGKLPPNGDDVPAARVRLSPAPAQQSELFRAIPRRHTHRGAYDTGRKLPVSLPRDLMTLADHLQVQLIPFDDARHSEIADLILQSTRRIIADREMATENAKWFRFRAADVAGRRDGLTLGANVSSPLVGAAGRLVPPPDALANRAWVADTRLHVRTAGLFGVIVVPDAHERLLAIEVGRLWQRAHLLLTALGIAAQPLNQPVERADREQELDLKPWASAALSRLIGDSSSKAAFVFRAGYASYEACLSPRRPLNEVIVDR